MQPLRTIARILIKFRYTKQVNLGRYEDFFKRQHLVEIREVIDVLPQIFEEFSSIKENSNVLKKRYDELVTHSKYDALTRVFNRGSLNVLIKELDTNTPANFAILMIDIDFFKLLNDSMGHQRGDEVLFAVAQTIHHNLAKKDLVYRYGGEEFCVILSDVNKENAFRVADRLCRTVEGLHLKNDGVVSGNVTISVGLSLVTDRPGQFRIEEMIAQADRALYEAKHAGRNRVHACNEAIALETHGISIGENKAHENTESKPEKKEDKDDSEPDPGQESSSAVIAQIAAIEQKEQERMIGSNDTDSLAMASFVGNEGSFSIGSFERAISLPSVSDSPELFDFDQDALKNMNEEERKATVEKLRAIEEDEAREVAEAANSLMVGLLGVFFINSNEDTSDYFDRQRKELNNYISTPAYFYYLERKKCQRELLEEAREKEILQAIQKAAEAQAAEAKIAEAQATEAQPAKAQATESNPAGAQATEAQSAEAQATEAQPAEAQADADVAAAAEAINEESSASSAGGPLAAAANGDADAANDKEKNTAVAHKSADTVAISNDSDDHDGSTSSSGSNNAGDTASQSASQSASQTDSGKSQSQELSGIQRTTLAASSGSCLVANADTAREVAAVIEAEERRSPRRKALRHLRRLNLRIKALRKYRNLRTAHTSTSMEHGVTEHIRRNYTSSTESAGHDSAVLIGVDYFESNSRSEGTNSIQLSQDGSAYEVSFTASELAHEVELRKEYNSKLNNAIGDTVSVRNEPRANVVVVDRDGYNEVSIGPHTVYLPDERHVSFDKDNSTSGDISQSKTDSKA
nr:GGDEF domain-containing protein [Anaerobiospirillum sp. NML02-A-032]